VRDYFVVMGAKKASEHDSVLLVKAWLDSEVVCGFKGTAGPKSSDRAWLRALRHWIATREARRRQTR
jgi:hypothetical protein